MIRQLTAVAMTCGLFVSPFAQALSERTQEPMGSSGLSSQDQDYMKTSAQGDLFEIAAGNIAVSKGSDAVARTFGARMVTDHTKSLNELRALAAQKNMTLPTEPSADQTVVLNYFRNSKSKDWSYDYLQYEVEDHKNDISDAQKEISQGSDPDVKSDAQKDLPVLQTHLNLAEQRAAQLGGS